MRQLAAVVGMSVLVALAAGGSSTRLGWLKTETPTAGAALARPGARVPTAASLVDYLNDNAGRVRTLRVDDLTVHASQGGLASITLSGRMLAEKPRGFRMGLDGPLGARWVDLGSNSEE